MMRHLPALLHSRWEQTLPPQRRRLLHGGLALVCAGWLGLLLLASHLATGSEGGLAAAMRRYGDAQDLAREYLTTSATTSPLATLPPLQAVQQTAAKLGIESRLLSMRPGQHNDAESVELTFARLDLHSLTTLLQHLQDAGLQIASCTLERPEYGEDLATLQLVLVR
ncbi:type II secretion system protein GspM [Megalodesulfovibrio gigas]|nr:type II secretion system protein GspM [Megalodesulfovibrio gigas]